jgi:hypothetical protein
MSQSAKLRSNIRPEEPGTRPDEAALDHPEAYHDKLRQGTQEARTRSRAPEGEDQIYGQNNIYSCSASFTQTFMLETVLHLYIL